MDNIDFIFRNEGTFLFGGSVTNIPIEISNDDSGSDPVNTPTVDPNPPNANGQTIIVDTDAAFDIILTGADAQSAITFEVTTIPSLGGVDDTTPTNDDGNGC